MALRDWLNSFKASSNTVKGAVNGVGNAGSAILAPLRVATRTVGGAVSTLTNAAGHTAAVTAGSVTGFFRSSMGKKIGIGALVLGGLATAGLMLGKSRGNQAKAEAEANDLAMMMPPESPVMPQAEMAAAPAAPAMAAPAAAETAAPGAWASKEAARAQAAAAQTAVRGA